MTFLDGPDTFTIGDVGVPAAVAPLGTFPSYRSSCGIGTPKLVDTLVARDAIPANYRAEGMTCFVQATGLTYQLVGGITNLDWVPFAGGAAALDAVLLVGNLTGGTDIEVTPGDRVRGEDSVPAVGNGSDLDLQGGAGGGVSGNGGSANLLGGLPTDGDGGSVFVAGSSGSGVDRNGGAVFLAGGAGTGTGLPGNANLEGGTSVGSAAGGRAQVLGGNGGAGGGVGGSIEAIAGSSGAAGTAGGSALLAGGNSGGAGSPAGSVTVRGGVPTSGDGGDVLVRASDGAGAAGDGGDLTLQAGALSGAGSDGVIDLVTGGTTRWTLDGDGELSGASGSKFDADGAVGLGKVTSIAFGASPYSVAADDSTILVNASGGPVIVNLPALALELRREIRVKKTDASANAVTITPDGIETIDGAATLALATQYESATLIAGSATDWSQFGASATPPAGVWGTNDFTNANCGAITEGQAVFVTTGGARQVDLADATADNAAARVIGFVVPASIASLAVGSIRTDGLATVRLVGGLVLTLGDEIFLGTTAGSCTNDISGYVPGNVAKTVGYLTDTLTYDGAGDLLVQVQIERGPKAVV